MKIGFFSDTKRIKKVVVGLILFITFFPVLKGYLINLGYNFIILTSINDALEGSKVHSKIANQGALLDIPPLIKREPIIKEYVIKKFPDASVFIHMVIYDDYHSIYFVRYYIPF